jgi:hypothetical protein
MAFNSDRYRKGSFPPFITFAEATSFAEEIYENGGGRATYDLLSRIFDNSIKSSSFTKKLAALKWYGIVMEPSKGTVVLTDIGTAIAAPQAPSASMSARKEAFLRIEPFARIYERHKGKLLPADEFLKNIFEQDSGIPKELSSSWVTAFREAIRVAGLLYDRGDQKTQIMESPIIPLTVSVGSSMEMADSVAVAQQSHNVDAYVQAPRPQEALPCSGLNFSLELSGGKTAKFFIPDKLKPKDVQKVRGALEGFVAVIDSLVSEEE